MKELILQELEKLSSRELITILNYACDRYEEIWGKEHEANAKLMDTIEELLVEIRYR